MKQRRLIGYRSRKYGNSLHIPERERESDLGYFHAKLSRGTAIVEHLRLCGRDEWWSLDGKALFQVTLLSEMV